MPIFRAQTFRDGAIRTQGFTLLELMVVVAILAAIMAIALPRLGGQNHQMRGAVRKLSALTRELHSQAKLGGVVYRLVIDLGDGDKQEGGFYSVEKGSNKTILSPEEMNNSTDRTEDEGEEGKAQLFSVDDRILKGKGELPSGLKFDEVEVRRLNQGITSGKAHIYFFPQGLADEAAIHLSAGENLKWTLIIHPLTGKSTVRTEHVTLKELTE